MKPAGKPVKAAEARRSLRKPLRTLGEIVGVGIQGLECTVLDMSGTGAKLKVTGAARKPFAAKTELPETFRLRIPRDNAVVECRLAWRDDDMIGVAFTTPFRPLKKGA